MGIIQKGPKKKHVHSVKNVAHAYLQFLNSCDIQVDVKQVFWNERLLLKQGQAIDNSECISHVVLDKNESQDEDGIQNKE